MKNNGKFLESIIDNSLTYYKINNLAIVHRVFLDISFGNVQENHKLNKAKIRAKSTVDYYGIYQGKFFAFDAKSTTKSYFEMKNIKKHQHEYLLDIINHKGLGFYIIGFLNFNEFYWISAEKLNFMSSRFSYKYIQKNGYKLQIILPGFLDFIPVIAKIISCQ
ncbi:penicillin-binding protein-related factor A recombinase [Mycoplasmopsis californica]|uniref:Holliday junction resolvase RecU n=1 Tax=Mycoplasmopsis equigenitalium TaxID=114883 RepID=A0ABY5J5P9_9BACT|nr:Holliday junction resolvase RecU [Mycoplasmopsis equigenitalium]UUD37206.1 Holliday junction resolvase RecU [Mycoplasmopsis equigenitalium]VEU69490.1 penicillin-binding protein-related factor A recombinase [Mycoplasmopsis californica]